MTKDVIIPAVVVSFPHENAGQRMGQGRRYCLARRSREPIPPYPNAPDILKAKTERPSKKNGCLIMG